MTTTKELVDILALANKDGKYDRMIEKAKNGDYHDFMSDNPTPKIHLVNDLINFPELGFLITMVRSGLFDE